MVSDTNERMHEARAKLKGEAGITTMASRYAVDVGPDPKMEWHLHAERTGRNLSHLHSGTKGEIVAFLEGARFGYGLREAQED